MKKSILLMMVASAIHLEAATELKPICQQTNLFTKSVEAFKGKYSKLDWSQENESNATGLSLFGKEILSISVDDNDGKVAAIHFNLHKNTTKQNSNTFRAVYNDWGKLLQEQIGKDVKGMPKINLNGSTHYRAAWSRPNGIYVLSRSEASGKSLDIKLSLYRKDLGIAYLKKSGYQSSGSGSRSSGRDSGGIAAQKSEISSIISEIMKRDAPSGITKKEQDAVNLLNVYRYLSKVSYNVTSDAGYNKAALDASQACKKANKLSHSLGHSTDKSNLAMNTGKLTMASSVTQYIRDDGDNNRERRGHRNWCLNHVMGKAGFGILHPWSAMYCMDTSGSSKGKNYAYPGIGAYPIKYLHGNGWSYYLAKGKVPGDCSVEVFKLDKYTEKVPGWSSEVSGKKLPVAYVNVHQSSVIFEPQKEPVTKTGTYLVRVEGSKLKEQYLVHLYK